MRREEGGGRREEEGGREGGGGEEGGGEEEEEGMECAAPRGVRAQSMEQEQLQQRKSSAKQEEGRKGLFQATQLQQGNCKSGDF